MTDHLLVIVLFDMGYGSVRRGREIMNVKKSGRRINNTSPIHDRILHILETAGSSIARSVNRAQVATNRHINQEIVEEEQQESVRADCGESLITALAEKLKGLLYIM